MKRFVLLLILILLFTVVRSPAKDHIFLSFSYATFDIIKQRKPSTEGRLELHFRRDSWKLNPFGGVMLNSDHARYIYAGFLYELPIFKQFHVIPSFAPGSYYGGKSKNLAFGLEFRSQIEIAFHFTNQSRIGISFSHLSNASLGRSNPGEESLAISAVIPLD
jgi:lipid A 3-O-deacylase